MAEPDLPDSVTPGDLDADARRDLRGLQKETAESVARHLVVAGMLIDEDPVQALQHARYARRRASRIAVVREAAGIAAYRAGEWSEALGEFRAARRMGGGSGHVPVMADIERALGRPERALDLTRGPEARGLDPAERVELLIVAAGARRDLGELDAAVVGLQVADLDPARRDPWSARLFYAYADNLLAAGRRTEAVQWFVHAFDADPERETDAAERIADLTGDAPPGAESDDDSFALGFEDVVEEPAGAVRAAPGAAAPTTNGLADGPGPASGERDAVSEDHPDTAGIAPDADVADVADAVEAEDAPSIVDAAEVEDSASTDASVARQDDVEDGAAPDDPPEPR